MDFWGIPHFPMRPRCFFFKLPLMDFDEYLKYHNLNYFDT